MCVWARCGVWVWMMVKANQQVVTNYLYFHWTVVHREEFMSAKVALAFLDDIMSQSEHTAQCWSKGAFKNMYPLYQLYLLGTFKIENEII